MSDFTGMTKHVGMLNNTGKNVVVVYMTLPGDTHHALVVDTDALPDSYNESLRKIVESVEGQQSKDLADVLGRRMSPDGSNTTLLQKFHMAGRLQKVPVSLVTMTPRKGVRWPLVDVLKAMDATKADDPVGFNDLDPDTRAALAADLKKFNVHANNLAGEGSANRKDEAIGLVRQAELLEADAQNMRQRAYMMDPALRRSVTKRSEKPSAILEDLSPLNATEPTAVTTKKTVAKNNDRKVVAEVAKPTPSNSAKKPKGV
jgi:hypothetical protein